MTARRDDERWMVRALSLAQRGATTVSPNPMVGAVVVRSNRVIGEGWHRRLGGDHAEVDALGRCRESTRGATLYVNLEPCNHVGRTPRCTEAVLAAGVSRVVVAMRDPNPGVAGGGCDAIRAAGIEVTEGILEERARCVNVSYIKQVVTGLPYVTLKAATSLDGRIATSVGESKWITCPAARAYGHRLRRWCDAILVGIRTVMTDDPRLDARNGSRRLRRTTVVLDSRLRLPLESRLLTESDNSVLVYTRRAPSSRAWNELVARGAQLHRVSRGSAGLELAEVFRDLSTRGLARVLVEGGGEVAASMLRGRWVDRCVTIQAPSFLGSDAVPSVGRLGIDELSKMPRFELRRIRRLGTDVLIESERRLDVP